MKLIETVNTATQTVETNEVIDLGQVDRAICCNTFAFNTTSISLKATGYYYIDVTVVGSGTSVGEATIQLQSNLVDIKGATATQDIAGAGNIATLNFSKIVRVLPNCSSVTTNQPQVLTVLNTGVGLNVTTINVAIVKVN